MYVVVIKLYLKPKVTNIDDTISTADITNTTIPDAVFVLPIVALLLPEL